MWKRKAQIARALLGFGFFSRQSSKTQLKGFCRAADGG
jgi:hypothetical protein